jgi:hypothetical protein
MAGASFSFRGPAEELAARVVEGQVRDLPGDLLLALGAVVPSDQDWSAWIASLPSYTATAEIEGRDDTST